MTRSPRRPCRARLTASTAAWWTTWAALSLLAAPAAADPPCFDPVLRAVSLRLRAPARVLRLPGLSVESSPDALVLRASPEALAVDWRDSAAVEALLHGLIREVRAAQPDHGAAILAVYTVGVTPRAPFYLPLANDVRGIGYQRLALAPAEVFRSGVDPRLQGLAFLGPLPAALADWPQARRHFLHELGHRFGIYAHFADGDAPQDAALGRNCSHWSALVDSGGSPLEGNRWLPAGPGRWRAQAVAEPVYHPLERYLMGLAPPEAVPPLVRLDLPPRPCAEPARNGEPNPAWRPPVGPGETWELAAGVRTLTVDQLIAAEGPRIPAWPEAPQRLAVRFVILVAGDEAVPSVALGELRRRLTAAWVAAASTPGLPAPVLDTEGPDGGPGDGGPGDGGPGDGGPGDGGPGDGGPGDQGALGDAGGPRDARPSDQAPAVGWAAAPGCQLGPGPGAPGWLALLAGLLRPRRRRGPRCAAGSRRASRAGP